MSELASSFMAQVVSPDLNTILTGSKKGKVAKASLNDMPAPGKMTLSNLGSFMKLEADEDTGYTKEQFGKAYEGIFPELEENLIRGEMFAFEVKWLLAEYLPQIPVIGKWVMIEDGLCAKLTKDGDSTVFESIFSRSIEEYDESYYKYLIVKVFQEGSDSVLEMHLYNREEREEKYASEAKRLVREYKNAIKYIEGKLFYNYSNAYATNTKTGKTDEIMFTLVHFERVKQGGDEYVYGFNAFNQYFRETQRDGRELEISDYIRINSYFGNEELGYLVCGDAQSMPGNNKDVFLFKDGYQLASTNYFYNYRLASQKDDLEEYELRPDYETITIYIPLEVAGHADPHEGFWEEFLEQYGFERKTYHHEVYYENEYGYKIRDIDGQIIYRKDFFDENGQPMIFGKEGYPMVNFPYKTSLDPFQPDPEFYDAQGNKVLLITVFNEESGEHETEWHREIPSVRPFVMGDLIHIASIDLDAAGFYNITLPRYKFDIYQDVNNAPDRYDLGDCEVEYYYSLPINRNYVNNDRDTTLYFYSDNFHLYRGIQATQVSVRLGRSNNG